MEPKLVSTERKQVMRLRMSMKTSGSSACGCSVSREYTHIFTSIDTWISFPLRNAAEEIHQIRPLNPPFVDE